MNLTLPDWFKCEPTPSHDKLLIQRKPQGKQPVNGMPWFLHFFGKIAATTTGFGGNRPCQPARFLLYPPDFTPSVEFKIAWPV
jgi:hypothetical protein